MHNDCAAVRRSFRCTHCGTAVRYNTAPRNSGNVSCVQRKRRGKAAARRRRQRSTPQHIAGKGCAAAHVPISSRRVGANMRISWLGGGVRGRFHGMRP